MGGGARGGGCSPAESFWRRWVIAQSAEKLNQTRTKIKMSGDRPASSKFKERAATAVKGWGGGVLLGHGCCMATLSTTNHGKSR